MTHCYIRKGHVGICPELDITAQLYVVKEIYNYFRKKIIIHVGN